MEIIKIGLISWVIAQGMKVLIYYLKTKKLNLKILTASGGIPSSHTAFIVATTFKIGIIEGINSPLFGFATILTFIIMYDAIGVRYSTGEQAKILNGLGIELEKKLGIRHIKVKEICGHTLIEVMAGFVIGTISGILF